MAIDFGFNLGKHGVLSENAGFEVVFEHIFPLSHGAGEYARDGGVGWLRVHLRVGSRSGHRYRRFHEEKVVSLEVDIHRGENVADSGCHKRAVVDEESVSATGTFAGATTVKFDDIEEISLESGIDRGKKSFGVDSMKLNAGKFRNDEFGVYNLYAYVDTDVYVVIKYNDEEGEEKYMVVNQEDEKSTHEFYDEVCDAILTHDPDFDGIKE